MFIFEICFQERIPAVNQLDGSVLTTAAVKTLLSWWKSIASIIMTCWKGKAKIHPKFTSYSSQQLH